MSHLHTHPKALERICSAFAKKGVDMFMSISPADKAIYLHKIVVEKEKRNQGLGTEALSTIVNYAEKTNKVLVLSPSIDFGASSLARLKRFYKRFGFVENKGRHKDYLFRETMFRRPRG